MQEEVTRGAVTLIVDGAKLSEQVFEKAVKKFLEEIQKSQKPKIYRGRQSLKQLASQNAGLANIEISDKNIKAFSHVAKKYHVDFALKKDTAAEQPRYLVFFKSRDADAITAAFQEFSSRKMSREDIPTYKAFRKPQNARKIRKTEDVQTPSVSSFGFSIFKAPSMAPSTIGKYCSGQSFNFCPTRWRSSLSSRMTSGLKYLSIGRPQIFTS